MKSEPNDLSSVAASTSDREILRARAQALARAHDAGAVAEDLLEVLEFSLGPERYGLETRLVREVYPLKNLTPIPCTPPFVAGVVNVRGRITCVIDIKKFFDLPDKGLTDLHRVILVRDDDLELGLLADAVTGVRSIARESLQLSLPTLTGIRSDYLKGVTSERLVVLDLERIVADPKIVVHEEVGS